MTNVHRMTNDAMTKDQLIPNDQCPIEAPIVFSGGQHVAPTGSRLYRWLRFRVNSCNSCLGSWKASTSKFLARIAPMNLVMGIRHSSFVIRHSSFVIAWLLCHWSLVIARAAAPSTNPPPPVVVHTNTSAASAVKFRNGDSLQGGLVGIDKQKQIHWTNRAIRPVMKFPLTNVAKVRLAPPPQPRTSLGNCVLRLLSGDQFAGNLLSLDADKVVLDTWYAGQMTFPRGQVRWLRSMQGGGYVYQGPSGLDGWTVSASMEQAGQPAWTYSGGTFYSRQAGGIARDVKLPDRAAIDFDVNWRQYLQLTITMYTDSLQVYRLPGFITGGGFIAGPAGAFFNNGQVPPVPNTNQPGAGFYAVHLNQGGVYLMTVRKNGEVSNSAVEMISGLESKTRAHISLRVDKIQKNISLLIDGKLAKTWQEGGEFAGRGTAIRFVQQGISPLALGHLAIGPWDGKLDTALVLGNPDDPLDTTLVPARPGTNDVLQLKNQDSFAGTLQHIRNGALTVKTSFGPLQFPLERVTEIDLATGHTAPLAPAAGSVRAFFADTDGRATFQIEQWNADKVIAHSPVFGRAEFKPAAFSLLEFAPVK